MACGFKLGSGNPGGCTDFFALFFGKPLLNKFIITIYKCYSKEFKDLGLQNAAHFFLVIWFPKCIKALVCFFRWKTKQ